MAWDARRNDELVGQLYDFAQRLRQLTIDGYLILGKFQANGVADDPAFVDSRGVAREDAVATIAVVADVVGMVRDGPVAQADREAVLSRILGGTLG